MSLSKKPSQNQSSLNSFRSSKLYHDWYNRVATGKPNDYVIAISAHPGWTGTSGTGKSTLAGGLAKKLDFSEGGFDASKSYTMDPSELAHDIYPNTEEGTVLLGDEMQGTLASTGMNAKRAMKTEQLEVYNTIAGRRRDRKTLILVFQSLKRANKDLFDFIDAWLLIVDDVDFICNHYAVMPDVFNMESNKTKTPLVERVSWDALPEDDPNYAIMEEIKSKANKGERTFTADSEDDEEEEDRMHPIKKAAEKIKSDGVENVVSIHGGHNKPILDTDLIQIEYNLSVRDAKKVKKLLEKDPVVNISETHTQ